MLIVIETLFRSLFKNVIARIIDRTKNVRAQGVRVCSASGTQMLSVHRDY
jgi:hypothetical protein